MKSVMFFGFSVTEATPGYVNQVEGLIGREFMVSKVGIGGVHPNHVKYFVENILLQNDIDVIVIDFNTSAFRGWLSNEEYIISLISILIICLKRDVYPIILDFPRKDVVYGQDWVGSVHSYLSQEFNIGYLDVAGKLKKDGRTLDDTLKDAVHPSDLGCKYYAEYVAEYFQKSLGGLPCLSGFSRIDERLSSFETIFLSKPILELAGENLDVDSYLFTRGGYSERFLCISEEEFIEIKNHDDRYLVSGLSYLMGPLSGTLNISSKNHPFDMNIVAYDQFCYYQRMGAKEFYPTRLGSLEISQTNEIPTIDLLKGEKNFSARIGNVGSLFFTVQDNLIALKNSRVFMEVIRCAEIY